MGIYMGFFITLSAVATMLIYAVPAYLLGKFKITKFEHIPVLAAILLYVCTPAIIVNSFQKAHFSAQMLLRLGAFLILAFALQLAILGIAWLFVRKKSHKVQYRISTIATSVGNCGFFGIPLIEALLPENPEAMVYVAVFSITMNTIAFTFGSLIISQDKKYIKPKKIFFNPAMLGAFVAIPLFVFGIQLPAFILSILDAFIKLSTPLCMFVLGMRLASIKFSDVFTNLSIYPSIFAKQIILPLLAALIAKLLPFDPIMETSLVIMCSCPVASVVLNLSELIGQGQKSAANCVLLGTILSIFTIPAVLILV